MAAPNLPTPDPTLPSTTIETITPELAKAMLATNTSNRTLRDRVVSAYTRDIEAGRWKFTGEALKFADDGTLLDGQHRLAAIVKSGVALQMLVIRGLDRTAQEAMDTGAKRTTADALTLQGQKHGTLLSSVAKMILTDGERLTNLRPSNTEIIEIVRTDPSLRWVVGSALQGDLHVLRRLASPSALGYAYWRLHAVDSFATAEFFHRLATLEELPSGSPILALHRRLSTHERRSDARKYRREAIACFFMAWNAWRAGESRSIIKLAYSQGQISVPEPK